MFRHFNFFPSELGETKIGHFVWENLRFFNYCAHVVIRLNV